MRFPTEPSNDGEGVRAAEPSVWSRFWLPSAYMAPIQGSASERSAARKRNSAWMKEHGEVYIVRWAALFGIQTWVVAAAIDLGVPAVTFLAWGAYFMVAFGTAFIVYFYWTVSNRLVEGPLREK